jgi:hypothetical protein
MNRTFDLAGFAVELPQETEEQQRIADDIVRAAIVLAHAALDDFIRSIGRVRYARLKGQLLKDVPLPGEKDTKFNLAAIAEYGDRTVDELIQESLDAYFARKSFNSASEVFGFVKALGINAEAARPVLPLVDELMKRRHRIVHQADFEDSTQGHPARLNPDDARRLVLWTRALDGLVFTVLAELAPSIGKADAAELARKTISETVARAERFRK